MRFLELCFLSPVHPRVVWFRADYAHLLLRYSLLLIDRWNQCAFKYCFHVRTIFRCKQKQYWGLVCFKIATVTNCLVYSGNGWEVIAFPSGEVIRPPPTKTNFRSFTSIFSFRQHVWNGTGLEDQEQRKTLPDI